jgi:UDP-N-acetyl-D-galactosamine dehydrogenase
MYQELKNKTKIISVTGLGYVGLPLALAFAKKFKVIGFDINQARVDLMNQGKDPSKELDDEAFEGADIKFTANPDDLKDAHFHIIGVPTDVDESKVPDLTPLKKASASVGKALKPGDYVVYESTVYPGCTEEDCLPILKRESGLIYGEDFKIGYSPERINPGDKTRPLHKIMKVVSGSDEEALNEIAQIYDSIIEAGVYRASSIKVAEAAKVIENTQRDINISLMNELSMIFDLMNIDTVEVLKAAGTKWNFLKFFPGLVGGHCIGVDPYYLVHKSKQLGYDPQVILSGRRINDGMPAFIAKRLTQMLIQRSKNPKHCKVLVMGITFKEDVSDIRNSKVADLVNELKDYSMTVDVVDPHASFEEVEHEYDLKMASEIGNDYDAIIVAVSHKPYKTLSHDYFKSITKEEPIVMDLKAIYEPEDNGMVYWRL